MKQQQRIVGSRKKKPQGDLYETHPDYVKRLLKMDSQWSDVWQPCSGINGYIVKTLNQQGINCQGNDIINGYDFFKDDIKRNHIITNPPFCMALDWRKHCKKVCNKFALLMRIQFLQTPDRVEFLEQTEFPLKSVNVFSYRIGFVPGGGIKDKFGGTICFRWYIWDKRYSGKPVIQWIKRGEQYEFVAS